MARMFISYSRANGPFVKELVPLLTRVFSNHVIWFDEHISGGEDWWHRILGEITRCDLFIYLLSNDALESEYCQAEFREALRLQKLCLPVIVAPNTDVSLAPATLEREIRRREWVDMSGGFRDYQANAKLYAAINRLLSDIPQASLPPLSDVPVGKPDVSMVHMRAVRKRNRSRGVRTIAAFVLVGIISVAIIIAAIGLLGNRGSTGTAATATQAITPTLELAFVVGTLYMQATHAQATTDANNTAVPWATSYAGTTENGLDQTATLWTTTPTPNIASSIQGVRTPQVETAAAEAGTATPAPTITPVTTATFTPTLPPEVRALTPVASNNAWVAVNRDFNGVEMVLVPAGCFKMGNDPQAYYWDGSAWIEGIPDGSQQCFNRPFWIDRYEVTNEQYGSSGTFKGPQHPRDNVTWFEARDFCARRGARLPTSVEWEYAARGSDSLIYPWGNEFIPDNVVYNAGGNSEGPSAEVGSRPGGVSWVGADDMSGNVWEWVSTIYGIYDYENSQFTHIYTYPYQSWDGREETESDDQTLFRVMRGGSWLNLDSHLHAASYDGNRPDIPGSNVGFRCARS